MTEQLTHEAFLPLLKKVFHVKDGRHALTLSRVDVHRISDREAAGLPRQPFTLIFDGPPQDVLREGLYALEVSDGPAFELYVIPVQTFVRDRQDYQVVFN
jgi:hypothetical protein